MAHVHANIGIDNYRVAIRAGEHQLTADEPPRNGGSDAGPAPYELLLSSLAACTVITLRMYAQRKRWDLQGVEADARFMREGDREHIERSLRLAGNLNAEQRTRLADVAERTPVTLTLKRGLEIKTTVS